MFNPRSIFLLISLLLVMLIVFDWGNINKEQKVEVSKSVQEKSHQSQQVRKYMSQPSLK